MNSALKDEILRFIAAHTSGDGLHDTPLEPLRLLRSEQPTLPLRTLYRPSLCIIVQGAKQVMLGEDLLHYGELQYLVVSVDMPLLGRITQASAARPYLAFILDIDVNLMREVLEQIGEPPRAANNNGPGIVIGDLPPQVFDGAVRLMNLLQTPQAIPVVYPAIAREIYYWLLTGPNGGAISRLVMPDSHAQRIAQAIHVLRHDFVQPIRIERLAAAAHMSASSFHQHFKAVTSMTPLQYQKQLRLLEARRLMMTDATNATHAAYQVGYASPSQFSREYARMFGAPPRRDVVDLRAGVA